MISAEERSTFKKLHLDDLFADLRKHGFSITLSDYEAVNRILHALSYHELRDTKILSSYLRPLMAKNSEQQEIFDHLFYRHTFKISLQYAQDLTNAVSSESGALDTMLIPKKRARFISINQDLKRIFKYAALALVALVALTFLVFLFINPREAGLPAPALTQQLSTTPLHSDSIRIIADSSLVFKRAQAVQNKTVAPLPKPELQFIAPDISPFQITDFASFNFSRFKNHISLSAIIIVCMLGFILERWLQSRRKLMLATQKNISSNTFWPMAINNVGIKMPDGHYASARTLGEGVFLGEAKFDILHSIQSAIYNRGYSEPSFIRNTRTPQYLLLIDTDFQRNHQAQLFETMMNFYRDQNVRMIRFYYRDDPRVCWNYRYSKGVDVRFLHNHYGDYRLIIFGKGDRFVNGATAGLETWTNQFKTWEYRIFIPRKLAARWGNTELQLSKFFTMVEGTPQGLSKLPDIFSALPTIGWTHQTPSIRINHDIDLEHSNDVVNDLKHYFNEVKTPILTKWIAGCCLYPHLYWDLTVLIGKILSSSNQELVTPDNLFKLSTLPWFQQGSIPEKVKRALVQDKNLLSQHERAAILKAILNTLKESAPQDESTDGYFDYQMNLLISEYLITESRIEKQKLWKKIQPIAKKLDQRDYILLSEIKHAILGARNIKLPKILNEALQGENPIPKKLRSTLRIASYFLFSLLLLSEIDLSMRYYDLVALNQKTYYLDTPTKKAAYLTHHASTLYNYLPDYTAYQKDARQYLDSAIRTDPSYMPAIVNLAILNKKVAKAITKQQAQKLLEYYQKPSTSLRNDSLSTTIAALLRESGIDPEVPMK